MRTTRIVAAETSVRGSLSHGRRQPGDESFARQEQRDHRARTTMANRVVGQKRCASKKAGTQTCCLKAGVLSLLNKANNAPTPRYTQQPKVSAKSIFNH